MKKLLSLFIVLALVTTFVMAENTSTMPDVKLGNISTDESTPDTTAVDTQIPEQPKAVRLFEDGEYTGFAIEMRDVDNQYKDYEQTYASQQQNFNPVFDGVFLKFDIANYKAEAELLDMYAIKNNVTVDTLNLEEETNNIVAEISANEQYKQQVITNYGTMEAFYQFVKMVKREELLRQEVLNIVAPLTDTAIEEEFVKQQSDLVLKYEQAKAKHILVETLEEAEKIKADIDAGKMTFEEAANEFTTDPGNNGNGGELGWIPRGKTVPEFEVAVFTAEIGKIANPVKSQFGYHLVLVEERKALRDLNDFMKMEEEYNTFTQQVQQTILTRWFREYMAENNITFEYNDYMRSIKKFGEIYTVTSQTGDYAPMVTFVVDFKPVSFNDRAFFEVAIQSILQIADQMPGLVSEEQKATINANRLENLKSMSTDDDNGFAALSRYYALNPSDTRMAIKFFDKFISEALLVAQDADFMTAYGDQIIAQLMQAYPGLQSIGEDTAADSRDRVVAYMYMIRINKITDDTTANKELANKILEIDPSNEEVLKLIED